MNSDHPNMMCISLAFVLPQTYCKLLQPGDIKVFSSNQLIDGTAMVMGSSWAHIWAKRNPTSFELLGFAIAAGLIAGEGIGGVVNAINM